VIETKTKEIEMKNLTNVILFHRNESGDLENVGNLFYPSDLDTDVVLEKAYQDTQNIDKPWHPDNLRSTSVGDLLVVNGVDVYAVGGVGFDKVGTL
jgi:hypothetical protein